MCKMIIVRTTCLSASFFNKSTLDISLSLSLSLYQLVTGLRSLVIYIYTVIVHFFERLCVEFPRVRPP